MTKKRAYGAGTVWQDERGRWRGQVRLDGKRHTVSGQTRGDARAELDRLIKQHDDGEGVFAPKTDGPPLVGEWLTLWADKLAGSPDESDNTRSNRAWAIGHLKPLADIRVDALATRDVRELLEAKAATLGRSSLDRIRSALYGALNAAIAEGHITHNVAAGRVCPIPHNARKVQKRRALTEAEARNMIEAAANDRDGIAVVLGIGLGMRPGEVCGLRWSRLDMDAGTLAIADDGMRRRNPDGSLCMAEVKAESERTLDVPPPVLDALARHKLAQAKRGHWDAAGLVWTARNGAPVDPSNHRRAVKRIAKAAGVFWSPTPNELRHTALSHAVDRGASLSETADMAGHANERMLAKHYRHKVRASVATANVLSGLFESEAQ